MEFERSPIFVNLIPYFRVIVSDEVNNREPIRLALAMGAPRDDFVLYVEEIGQGLVEPLGPEMIAGFGVDQLHVDAHAVAAALNAALEDIANVQLASDLSSRSSGLPL